MKMYSLMMFLKRTFPLLGWIKGYDTDKAVSDLIAGITIGLTLIPQSIAYASLAGLEPQYGLYSSLCGAGLYLFFGTIPEMSIAPTALISLLTYSYTNGVSFGNANAAVLLCFLSGCVELVCGLAHLGFLVDFVSTPVVAAFTTAVAITISSSQIKSLLGLRFQAANFIEIWFQLYEHIDELRPWDTLLGLTCCIILLFLRKVGKYGSPVIDGKERPKEPTIKKILWLLSVGRNALVIVSCSIFAFLLKKHGQIPFTLTGRVPGGFPEISPPPFVVEKNNRTITFGEMVSELNTAIIFIPLISIISAISIGKSFARGRIVDATQEMIAVGICNFIGSFFKSYPVNASFARGALGYASGIQTPLAGIYSAALIILAFTFLTSFFAYIPKSAQAAVIICAVSFMVEFAMTKHIWKVYKIDLIPFFITLISCLVIGVEMGLIIGLLTDVLKILYFSSRPKLLVQYIMNAKICYMEFTPTASLLYSAAEYMRETLLKECLEKEILFQHIIINCERIQTMDYTVALCMTHLVKDLEQNNKTVIFVNITSRLEPILKELIGKNSTVFNELKDLENYLLSTPDVNKSFDDSGKNGVNGSHM